nr:unnamed protein product [Digitaria exilis]
MPSATPSPSTDRPHTKPICLAGFIRSPSGAAGLLRVLGCCSAAGHSSAHLPLCPHVSGGRPVGHAAPRCRLISALPGDSETAGSALLISPPCPGFYPRGCITDRGAHGKAALPLVRRCELFPAPFFSLKSEPSSPILFAIVFVISLTSGLCEGQQTLSSLFGWLADCPFLLQELAFRPLLHVPIIGAYGLSASLTSDVRALGAPRRSVATVRGVSGGAARTRRTRRASRAALVEEAGQPGQDERGPDGHEPGAPSEATRKPRSHGRDADDVPLAAVSGPPGCSAQGYKIRGNRSGYRGYRSNRPGPVALSFSSGEKPPPAAQPPRAPGSRAAANRPGSRRRGSRLPTPANRSGFRSVSAVTARPRVVHCEKVSKEVREYFQRELERTKKLTAQRAQEKLRKEKATAEGNYPGGGEAYDEEAELQRALNQSRAEEEFRRGVQQRGGAYEHGGGSSTRGEGTLQRMLRRATSARQTPGVTDYNLAKD